MESSLHRYRSQLETTPWFRGLPVELRDYLISHASLLTLEKGQFLYRRGEQSYGLYAVLGGAEPIVSVGADFGVMDSLDDLVSAVGRAARAAIPGSTSARRTGTSTSWSSPSRRTSAR